MRRHLIWLAACLALAVSASPATAQAQTRARYMGDMSCGGWRAAAANYTETEKALALNWVLGILFGRSAIRGDNVLDDVQISSVAAWLDDHCSRNPLDTITTAAFELEKVLIARRAR